MATVPLNDYQIGQTEDKTLHEQKYGMQKSET